MKLSSLFVRCATSAALLTASLGLAAASDQRVWIAYKDGGKGAVQAALKSVNADVHYSMDNRQVFAATIASSALQGLQRNPRIDYIEEDARRFPMAETSPYGIAMVQANLVSDEFASNRTICIIDSGYDLAHEDLVDNEVTGSLDSGTGYWWTDELHHGTHVAGTIAAMNNNVGVVGVLPKKNIQLFIVKVFNADGWAYSSDLVAALDVCETAGANVVNMSLGGTFKSRTENKAFAAANGRGVLSVAAAGNDGNTRKSYPASYGSVVSVAAVDSDKVVAEFSQQNGQVELAAPGVAVKSTVPMGTGREAQTSVNGSSYQALAMEGTPLLSGTGDLVDCGTAESPCSSSTGAVVCLIRRGVIAFSDKVLNCQAGGGVAAIIYNNVPGPLSGTLGGVATTIPSVGASGIDGAAMLGQLGESAFVSVTATNYAFFDGTSMATPHVSGVAALVWSHYESCSNDDIRAALGATAEDLGAAGRDSAYGFGLVQAQAAMDFLYTNGCSDGGGGDPPACDLSPGASCSNNSECCSNSCKGKPGSKICR